MRGVTVTAAGLLLVALFTDKTVRAENDGERVAEYGTPEFDELLKHTK